MASSDQALLFFLYVYTLCDDLLYRVLTSRRRMNVTTQRWATVSSSTTTGPTGPTGTRGSPWTTSGVCVCVYVCVCGERESACACACVYLSECLYHESYQESLNHCTAVLYMYFVSWSPVLNRHAGATLVRRLVSISPGLASTPPGFSLPPLLVSLFSSMVSPLSSTQLRKYRALKMYKCTFTCSTTWVLIKA